MAFSQPYKQHLVLTSSLRAFSDLPQGLGRGDTRSEHLDGGQSSEKGAH